MTINNLTTLTAAEAAKILGLSTSTLAKLRLGGTGPVYCKLGRRVVYRSEDLAAWLNLVWLTILRTLMRAYRKV